MLYHFTVLTEIYINDPQSLKYDTIRWKSLT